MNMTTLSQLSVSQATTITDVIIFDQSKDRLNIDCKFKIELQTIHSHIIPKQ